MSARASADQRRHGAGCTLRTRKRDGVRAAGADQAVSAAGARVERRSARATALCASAACRRRPRPWSVAATAWAVASPCRRTAVAAWWRAHRANRHRRDRRHRDRRDHGDDGRHRSRRGHAHARRALRVRSDADRCRTVVRSLRRRSPQDAARVRPRHSHHAHRRACGDARVRVDADADADAGEMSQGVRPPYAAAVAALVMPEAAWRTKPRSQPRLCLWVQSPPCAPSSAPRPPR